MTIVLSCVLGPVHSPSSVARRGAGAVLPAEELETQLRRTLFLASRATDKRVAAAAGAGYIFLQRAAAASRTLECQMKGLHSAQAAVSDFFLKKKSRLQRTLLETLLRRVPSLVPRLLPATLHHAAAARNEYLRLEAFVLLATALKVLQVGFAGLCDTAADTLLLLLRRSLEVPLCPQLWQTITAPP